MWRLLGGTIVLQDSFAGGLILTLVNMTTVFLVLGFLALLIKGVHAVLSRIGAEEPALPPRSVLVVSSHSESEEEEIMLPDNIGPAKKAAILAAISVYLAKPETPMFLRNGVRDSGVWGKQSRKNYAGAILRVWGQPDKSRRF